MFMGRTSEHYSLTGVKHLRGLFFRMLITSARLILPDNSKCVVLPYIYYIIW